MICVMIAWCREMCKRGRTIMYGSGYIAKKEGRGGVREAALLLEWIYDNVERDVQEGWNYEVLERICS